MPTHTGDSDPITQDYLNAGIEDEPIGRGTVNRETQDEKIKFRTEQQTSKFANLLDRKNLRRQISEAFEIKNKKERRKKLRELSDVGINELGIAEDKLERVLNKEQKSIDDALEEKKRRDDFFERNKRSRSLNQKRTLYSPNRQLRLAKRLRKQGFMQAAEDAARAFARSPEAMAPAISTPSMRAQMDQDNQRLVEIEQENMTLRNLIMNNRGNNFPI